MKGSQYGDINYGWPVSSIWSFDLADSAFPLVHRHMGSYGWTSVGLLHGSDGVNTV